MRLQYIRASVLFGVHVLILLHIFYFKNSAIGSIDFQEFFHSFLKLGLINSGVILVLFSFIVTLIFGRFFCGWACHFGAIQELSWMILKKLNIKPITINSRLVVILPLIVLLNYYVLPNAWYALNNPWKLDINLATPDIWAFLPGAIIGSLTFLIDGFLIVYFLGKKGFCRFICPWGAFLKIPNMFSMFKVRKTGECTLCHECTTGCPVGIDVSYEINHYGKVNNTNCTSCMICTTGCPSNALSYKFKNPIDDTWDIKGFINGTKSYLHPNIKGQFLSVRSRDVLLLILTIFFALCIDGLYGMGHFMSYGIALIAAFSIVKIRIIKFQSILFPLAIIIIFSWHGVIKYSIWKGIQEYKSKDYVNTIKHLERATSLHLKQIGLFHVYLSESYFNIGDIYKSAEHAERAYQINPDYESTKKLIIFLQSTPQVKGDMIISRKLNDLLNNSKLVD